MGDVTLQALTWDWPDTPILIVVTLLLAGVARLLLAAAIRKVVAAAVHRAQGRTSVARADRLLAHATGIDRERFAQRASTLGSLLGSIATFIIALVALLTVMSAVGLPLAPLLASAGVGGVALGFGAQSLVRDFLSGVFMIIEDQYGVGDIITVGDVTGTVEDVSLRVTRVKDEAGLVWYLRNGDVTKVGNHSQA